MTKNTATQKNEFSLRTTLTEHTAAVWSCAASSTSKYFITGSSDNTIKVWNAFHCCLHANIDVGQYVYSCTLSLDGRTLIAAAADNTMKVRPRPNKAR